MKWARISDYAIESSDKKYRICKYYEHGATIYCRYEFDNNEYKPVKYSEDVETLKEI